MMQSERLPTSFSYHTDACFLSLTGSITNMRIQPLHILHPTLLLALFACSGADAITAGPDLTSPGQLVGSYNLVAYRATPGSASGSLTVKADSTYTLSLNVSSPWSGASSGRWSYTREGNFYLPAINVYGSIERGGLGMGGNGYPAVYFRKR